MEATLAKLCSPRTMGGKAILKALAAAAGLSLEGRCATEAWISHSSSVTLSLINSGRQERKCEQEQVIYHMERANTSVEATLAGADKNASPQTGQRLVCGCSPLKPLA
jgi:hypothetical protein